MTDLKRLCPVCDSYTSSVGMGVLDGTGCPHCGASTETILEIDRIREQKADEQLRARVEELLVENAGLKKRNRTLEQTVSSVRYALKDAEGD